MSFTARRRFNVAQEEGVFRVTTTTNTTAGDFVYAGPVVQETYAGTATGTDANYNPVWGQWTTSDRTIVTDEERRAQIQARQDQAIEEARQLDHTRRLVRDRQRRREQEVGYPFLTHRLYEERPTPQRVQYDLGYQIGQHGDETHERVPITRKIRVRIAPPRRDAFGHLVDHADNFEDREITDEDDWEIKSKPFNLTRETIQIRMKDRRERMVREEEYRKGLEKSFELLKSWLTPNEYRDLMDDGLVKIQTGDETYTIKKDPGQFWRPSRSIFKVQDIKNYHPACSF